VSAVSILERLPLSMLSPAGGRARLLVLTFHRVLPARDPLLPDDPDVHVFAEQMSWVARYCRVLRLPDAVGLLQRGMLPDRSCCVTFDDGYANNYDVALPVLKRLGLTASVFIATDAIERGIMWNDIVIEAVRRAGPALRSNDLAMLGLESADLRADASAVEALLNHLKYRPLDERWHLAGEFYRRVAREEPPRLMMSAETLRELARAGVDIGAHTVHHPILKTLAPDRAREEIVGSRDWLATVVGTAPRAFAYPNGRPGRDYDETHVAMVKDAGFEVAVSTSWGCATSRSDVFQLPRAALWDRTRTRYWLRLLRTYASSYWN
jgi:peptidoglycan/xylan/chitin deacetylase (PgdA/CDA1 family)